MRERLRARAVELLLVALLIAALIAAGSCRPAGWQRPGLDDLPELPQPATGAQARLSWTLAALVALALLAGGAAALLMALGQVKMGLAGIMAAACVGAPSLGLLYYGRQVALVLVIGAGGLLVLVLVMAWRRGGIIWQAFRENIRFTEITKKAAVDNGGQGDIEDLARQTQSPPTRELTRQVRADMRLRPPATDEPPAPASQTGPDPEKVR